MEKFRRKIRAQGDTFFFFMGFFLFALSTVKAHVICDFRGRLGNQLFQAAAAVALAEDNACSIYFPQFEKLDCPTEDYGLRQLRENYQYILRKIPHLQEKVVPSYTYVEPDFQYYPIPYQEHTAIVGYFISEKHFRKYKDLIVDLFSPTPEIELALLEKFSEIINHPQSVGIHVRTGHLEYKLNNFDKNFYENFLAPDLEYFKRAIEMFDEKALFVVFSDHIDWCKENFAFIDRDFLFIENQSYIDDFYLLSKCKHAILANSTFAWWSAYLNKNPDKKIVCRKPFWIFDLDVSCPEWMEIPMEKFPPVPYFKGDL